MLVVSNNRANMMKAIRILQAQYIDTLDDGESEECGEVNGEDEEEENEEEDESEDVYRASLQLELPHVPFRRMPCLAHTLQLIVKSAYVTHSVVLRQFRRGFESIIQPTAEDFSPLPSASSSMSAESITCSSTYGA